MNKTHPPQIRWLKDWRLVLLVIVACMVIGFLGGRPLLLNLQPGESADFQRAPLGAGDSRFETPQGLIYSQNRLDHVMRHSQDDPGRNQKHGVFDVDTEDEVLELIDLAYSKVASEPDDVQTERERGREIHTINMGRRVGFEGGKSGKQRGNPECQHVRIVVERRSVITAYPLRK